MEVYLEVARYVGEHADNEEDHQHVGHLPHHVWRVPEQRPETFREFCKRQSG